MRENPLAHLAQAEEKTSVPKTAESGGKSAQAVSDKEWEMATANAEDEADVEAMKSAKAEEKEELADFNEEDAERGAEGDNSDEYSKVASVSMAIESELTSVQRYALNLLEAEYKQEGISLVENVHFDKDTWEKERLRQIRDKDADRLIDEDEILYYEVSGCSQQVCALPLLCVVDASTSLAWIGRWFCGVVLQCLVFYFGVALIIRTSALGTDAKMLRFYIILEPSRSTVSWSLGFTGILCKRISSVSFMSLQIPMTRRIGRSTSPCTNRIQVCLHRAVVGSEAVSLGCACKRRLLAQRLFGWPGHLPGPLHTPQTMQLELHTRQCKRSGSGWLGGRC